MVMTFVTHQRSGVELQHGVSMAGDRMKDGVLAILDSRALTALTASASVSSFYFFESSRAFASGCDLKKMALRPKGAAQQN